MDGGGSTASQGKHGTLVKSSLRGQNTEALTLVQEALRLSFPVLSKYPDQIASQLTGRLLTAKNEGIQELLSRIQVIDSFWLRPLTPSLFQAGGALLQTLIGHTNSINKIIVTPDNRYAISASVDGTLKLWNLRTGMEVHTFQAQYPVYNTAVSCSGQRLIASVRSHEVKVWDTASGRELWSMACDAGGLAAIPESTLALLANGIDLLGIDLSSFEIKFTLSGHEQFIETVTISKDGLLAASGTDEGDIRIWDLERMKQYRSFNYGGFIYDLSFTPDNRYLLSVGDCYAQLWDLKNSQEAKRFTLKSPQRVKITSDGQVVFFTSENGVSSWDIHTGKLISILLSDANIFTDLQLSADERCLLTASEDHTVRVWRLDRLGKSDLFPGHEYWNIMVRFSADRRRAISWGKESIKVWDVENHTPLFEISDEHRRVQAVRVTPDGRYGFLLIDDEQMTLYDLADGKVLADLRAYKAGNVESVEVAPDRSRVLAVYESFHRGGDFNREFMFSNWLCIWEIDQVEGSYDEDEIPRLYPVAECKIPQPPKTRTSQGTENIGDNPEKSITRVTEENDCDWSLLDPNSGQKMGDLRSYLHWPTGLLDIPGLVEEPVSEPVDGQIKIKINKAGQLVVLDQHTEQLSLAFTCEGEAVSFDLHLDHHTIIVGDNKGKIYFLQIEGYPPQS